MSEALDLIVIGAGPGGYVAAIKAAQLGLKTALVEEREVGGTCLNRGCIPTKALVHAGETLENIKQCETLGLMAGDIGFDFTKMHARKTQVVTQMRTGIEGLLKANKVQLILGRALVLSSSQVQVGEEILQTKRVLIATGSSPSRIPIEGAELCVTSDELLEGEGRFYKRLCIIGGGVIGMEFASIYTALGCQVTVIEAMDRILPTMDREISQNLAMIPNEDFFRLCSRNG